MRRSRLNIVSYYDIILRSNLVSIVLQFIYICIIVEFAFFFQLTFKMDYDSDSESNENYNNDENNSELIVLEKTQKIHFLPIYDSFASI